MLISFLADIIRIPTEYQPIFKLFVKILTIKKYAKTALSTGRCTCRDLPE
jgi:hypothetical protein